MYFSRENNSVFVSAAENAETWSRDQLDVIAFENKLILDILRRNECHAG